MNIFVFVCLSVTVCEKKSDMVNADVDTDIANNTVNVIYATQEYPLSLHVNAHKQVHRNNEILTNTKSFEIL